MKSVREERMIEDFKQGKRVVKSGLRSVREERMIEKCETTNKGRRVQECRRRNND